MSSYLDSVKAEELQQHARREGEAVDEAHVAHGAQADGHGLYAGLTVIRQQSEFCAKTRNARGVLLFVPFAMFVRCCCDGCSPREDTVVTWRVKLFIELQLAAISPKQETRGGGCMQQ